LSLSSRLVSPPFLPLLPLLPILLRLILPSGSCILILLCSHHTNALASERGQSRSSGSAAVAVTAAIAKDYGLGFACRAVGPVIRGAR
jgi:hypothetical protein